MEFFVTVLQGECELIKIDINCHIQGDVVIEGINLNDDMEHEMMMFRVMFNTAFVRSNILMLNRDEIDVLWDAKDHFPKDFRAEVDLDFIYNHVVLGHNFLTLNLFFWFMCVFRSFSQRWMLLQQLLQMVHHGLRRKRDFRLKHLPRFKRSLAMWTG
jgi:hypothetical protein